MVGGGTAVRADVDTVSGTPAYIKDPQMRSTVCWSPRSRPRPPVSDNAGQCLGDVEGVEIDPASGRITRVIVRRGVIFRTETAIPASVIASVGDRIALSVGADEVKKLAHPFAGEPGRPTLAEMRVALSCAAVCSPHAARRHGPSDAADMTYEHLLVAPYVRADRFEYAADVGHYRAVDRARRSPRVK